MKYEKRETEKKFESINKKTEVGLSIIFISILFLMCGCQSKEDSMNFRIFPKSNTEKAKEYVDIVFNAVSEEDEDAVFNLFSDKVKEEVGEEELRSQIKELIRFYQGTEIQSKEGVVEDHTGNEYGVKKIRMKVLYGIKTDNGDYEIALTYVARADENPKEEGFECLQIAKKETVEETEGFMWEDYNIYHGIIIFE